MELESDRSGLQCLQLLLRFHQISVDQTQIQHRFSGAPIGVTEMLRCAKELKLKKVCASERLFLKCSFGECDEFVSYTSDRSRLSKRAGLASGFGQMTFFVATFAPALFIFDRQIAKLIAKFDFTIVDYPTGAFLLRQYEFIRDCRYLESVFDVVPCKRVMAGSLEFYDFQLFVLLVWGVCILCLLRVIFELINLSKLDRFSEKIVEGGVSRFLFAIGFLGPVTFYMSVDFEFASSSDVRGLITWSPRAFLALSTFLACFSAAFAAQGVLVLSWLLFRRPWLVFRQRKLRRKNTDGI